MCSSRYRTRYRRVIPPTFTLSVTSPVWGNRAPAVGGGFLRSCRRFAETASFAPGTGPLWRGNARHTVAPSTGVQARSMGTIRRGGAVPLQSMMQQAGETTSGVHHAVAQSALRYISFMRDEIAVLPDCPLRAAFRHQLEVMERAFPTGPRATG